MRVRLLLTLYYLAGCLSLAAAGAGALLSPRWRKGLRERLGRSVPFEDCTGEVIWIHGASVGEVLAADGLLKGLAQRRPDARLVLSTFTATGREAARRAYDDLGDRIAFTLAPLDWGGIPERVLSRCRPALCLILETELWPGFISALDRRDIPLVLANGRLSGRSFPRYRALRWFFRPFLEMFSLVCVRTAEDGERFRRLGVREEKLLVAGNVKHEVRGPMVLTGKAAAWKRTLDGRESEQVIVAGSLRGRESRIFVDAFKDLRRSHRGLRLVLAPRHPDRFDPALLESSPLRWVRWSEVPEGGPDERADVILVDTLGDLAGLYAVAAVAFVGGTIDGVEGHNLLEPAFRSVPVLFGPGYRSFQDEGDTLISAGGGFLVPDHEAIVATVSRLLEDLESRKEAGRRARETAEGFGGAVEKTLGAIDEVLEEHRL